MFFGGVKLSSFERCGCKGWYASTASGLGEDGVGDEGRAWRVAV